MFLFPYTQARIFLISHTYMSREKVIASIDIGSQKVRSVIGVLSGEGKNAKVNIIGLGVTPSTGLRK